MHGGNLGRHCNSHMRRPRVLQARRQAVIWQWQGVIAAPATCLALDSGLVGGEAPGARGSSAAGGSAEAADGGGPGDGGLHFGCGTVGWEVRGREGVCGGGWESGGRGWDLGGMKGEVELVGLERNR